MPQVSQVNITHNPRINSKGTVKTSAFFFAVVFIRKTNMSYITLSDAKKHLNIETEFIEDDQYLTNLIEVAEISVTDYCNSGLSGYTESTIPKTVRHATILLIAHLYINRTLVSFQQAYEIPYAFKFLLDPYKNRLVV